MTAQEQVQQAIANDNAEWQRRLSAPSEKDSVVIPPNAPSEVSFPSSQGSVAAIQKKNWQVTVAGTRFTVANGSYAATIPTLGGVSIDTVPAPRGTISGVGTEYVWLKAQWSLTSSYSYVTSAFLASVIVESGAAVPAENRTAGTYYIQVATLHNRAVVLPQPISTSLAAYIYDDGTQTSSAIEQHG